MRVLMTVAHSNVRGAIPKLTPIMQEGLESLGCTVDIAPYGRHVPHAEREGVLRKIVERMQDLIVLIRIARKYHPDLLFINTTHDWLCLLREIPLVIAMKAMNIPAVIMYHGSSPHKLMHLKFCIFKWFTRLSLNLGNGLLVLSSEEKKGFLREWPHLRCQIVKYPVEIKSKKVDGLPKELPKGWGDGKIPILLFVGRLIPEKGICELIEAIPQVLSKIYCRLVVLGEGNYQSYLQQRVKELNLEDNVFFGGFEQDNEELYRWYRASTVFVLPTYHNEGFPVVVLEAVAAGLPIITSPIRGPLTFMNEGVNAFFVPPKQTEKLANCLVEVLLQNSLRERMSAENRIWIRNFEPSIVMREYLDFFEQTIALKQRC